jgi:hypothetical protein
MGSSRQSRPLLVSPSFILESWQATKRRHEHESRSTCSQHRSIFFLQAESISTCKKICFLPELLSSSVPLLWFISYSELLNKELQVGNLCSAATTKDHKVALVNKELFTRIESITNEGWWRRLNQVLPYENLQTKYCIIFGATTRAPSMEFATRTWNINISTTEIILYTSFSDLRNPKKLDPHAQRTSCCLKTFLTTKILARRQKDISSPPFSITSCKKPSRSSWCGVCVHSLLYVRPAQAQPGFFFENLVCARTRRMQQIL